ncbi:MAG: DUF4129 domain-containing protein [Caldilineaceae bacterium]
MRSKQLNWLNDSPLIFFITLVRFAWLWPWLGLARSFLAPSYTGQLLNPWLLIAVPLASSVLLFLFAANNSVPDEAESEVRAPETTSDVPLYSRLLVAGLGLLMIVAILWWQFYGASYAWWDSAWLQALGDQLIHWSGEEIPAPVLTILVLIFLWLKGLADAVRQMTHDDIWGSLVTGVVAMAIYLLAQSATAAGLPANTAYLVVLLFGAGMAALAFSSIKITVGLDRALGLGQRRTSRGPAVNRYWLFSVATTVGGLLGLGVLIGILVAPEQIARLLAALGAVMRALWEVVDSIVLAIAYVLVFIVYLFAKLLEPLIRRLLERLNDNPMIDRLQVPQTPEALPPVVTDPGVVPDSYRWIGLAIFVLIILVIFALAVRRMRSAEVTDVEETRESILTASLLQNQLNELWQRWFGRRQGATDPFLSLQGEAEARRRIRAAYQQLLTTTADLGQARQPSQTPLEYHQRLQLPATAPNTALATIARGYHAARYAPDAPSVDEAAAVEQAWHELAHLILPQEPAADDSNSQSDSSAPV